MRRRATRSVERARAGRVRDQGPSYLIVCEGKQTERLYFEGFRAPNATVVGTGFNTVTLVEEAIRLNADVSYDRTWCVFDKDSFPAEDFQAAIDLCRKHGFGAAYSNEAFELWYLLHFDYHTSALSRTQYGEKLANKLGRPYAKNDPTLFEVLRHLQEMAIRNACRLLASYDPHLPHRDNPCPSVHILVQELRAHSRA